MAPAVAHPQSHASCRGASRAGIPATAPPAPSSRPPQPPAPGPAGSLGAIRWRHPISSLFREVFSDGKGEKGICEPCKPIPLSWVNKGSSVGSRMPGCRSRGMGLKSSLSPAPSWGATDGDPQPPADQAAPLLTSREAQSPLRGPKASSGT